MFAADPDGEYVALDTETTSLDTKTAEIIAIGAVRIQGKRILTSDSLDLLVKPSGIMAEASIKTHHLRVRDLSGGMEPSAAIRRLLHFIGGRTLVGYYLEFDITLLNRYVQGLYGFTLPNTCVEVSAIYHKKKLGMFPHKNLDLRFETIRHDLGIPPLGEHNALNDALMTAMIFVKLQNLDRLPPT